MLNEGSQGRRAPIEDRAIYVVLVIVVLHVVVAWYTRDPGLGWTEDDAEYLLLARQLQHFGYRESWDILSPLHARYPPGFPFMLALVGAVVANNLQGLAAFVTLCSAAAILFWYDAIRRVLGWEVALLSTLLYASNPDVLRNATMAMSETPFTLLVCAALWAVTREREGRRFSVLAGGLTVAAALTRSAGIVFLPALALHWLLARRPRHVLGLALASSLVAGWLVFAVTAPNADDHRLYVADMLGATDPQLGLIARTVQDIPRKAFGYLTYNLPGVLALPTLPNTPVDNVLWALAVTGGLAMGLFFLARAWPAAALFAAAYGALLLVWVFRFNRLVDPIVPLIVLLLVLGFRGPGTSVGRIRRTGVVVLVGIILFGALRRDVGTIKAASTCDRTNPAVSAGCWTPMQRDFLRLANWVRDSVPGDATFFVPKEASFHMHSLRKTINHIRGLKEDSASLGNFLRQRGVGYSVLSLVGPRGRPHSELVRDACHEFDIVREFGPTTFLLKVRDQPTPTDSTSTCVRLRSAIAGLPPIPPDEDG